MADVLGENSIGLISQFGLTSGTYKTEDGERREISVSSTGDHIKVKLGEGDDADYLVYDIDELVRDAIHYVDEHGPQNRPGKNE